MLLGEGAGVDSLSVGKSDGGAVGLLEGIDVTGFTSGDLDRLVVGD